LYVNFASIRLLLQTHKKLKYFAVFKFLYASGRWQSMRTSGRLRENKLGLVRGIELQALCPDASVVRLRKHYNNIIVV
jgi:hypothetical protein